MQNFNQNPLQEINNQPYPVINGKQVLRVTTVNVGEDKTMIVCLFEDGSQEAVEAAVYYGEAEAPEETPVETPETGNAQENNPAAPEAPSAPVSPEAPVGETAVAN